MVVLYLKYISLKPYKLYSYTTIGYVCTVCTTIPAIIFNYSKTVMVGREFL